MNQSLSLIISILLILILIRRIHVGFAVFIGALTLGFLTVGFKSIEILLSTLKDFQTIKFIAIFVLAFTLAYSMQESGALDKITRSATSLFGKASTFVIPSMIGFLPMPGGAIVSAVMLRDVFKRFGFKPEKATFLNYWFRHIWACIDPIYPSVIIALAVLEIDYMTLIKSTYPITIAMAVSGIPFISFERLRVVRDYTGMLYVMPIILVMILTALGIDLLYSLATILTMFCLFVKPNMRVVVRNVFNLRIFVLLISLLYFKEVIIETNSASSLLRDLNFLPQDVVAFSLSFIVGFATGIESGYSAIAFPLLIPFIGFGEVVSKNLLLVAGGGILGVMLSPLHLCLILTREYYSSNLEVVYLRYLIPSSLLTFIIIIIFYLTGNLGI
ncbi:MAG: hypothetical protein DRP01_06595 [Archaeoglobales archaeon]|nr:MAG: hypothetical protein DRP01_06595 [Archaeoglobales archaeon]